MSAPAGQDRGWWFETRSAYGVDHDVTEGAQFNNDDIELDEALVREATQNSQDASAGPAEPVRVRLSLAQGAALDAEFLHELTDPLLPRLEASGFKPDLSPARAALVIEDFGTKGLTGDWIDDSDQGAFRSFWFRHGRSFKGEGKGGRWGLGKLVFPMSSRTRCHFGLTARAGEAGGLLLGQAVLKTHVVGGGKHAPHGHWGERLDGDKGVAPVTDPAFLKRFSDAFGLTRKGEPGLSVVVPWPRHTPDADELTRYVVRNYAFPILTNRLVFDVMGVAIDAAAVREFGKTTLLPAGLIDFIDAVNEAKAADLHTLAAPRLVNQTYQINDGLLAPDVLIKLRTAYAAGERVGLRVPVALRRKVDPAETASFVDVHLKAAGENQTGAALCVRGDITVPDEAKAFRADTHFALLMARDPAMSEFLGDAENPAHTKWSEKERLTANWRDYPTHKLRLVKACVPALHKLLATGKTQTDASALIDFFWIDDPDAGKGGQAKPKARKGAKIVATKPEGLPPVLALLNISKVERGFTIRPGPGFAKRPKPAKLLVDVAYDVMGANPVKAWSPFDFDLDAPGDDVVVEVEGALHAAKGRRIALTIPGPDFRLTVVGFDPKRDLYLRPTWVRGSADV